MKNKFSPGEKVLIKARIKEARNASGAKVWCETEIEGAKNTSGTIFWFEAEIEDVLKKITHGTKVWIEAEIEKVEINRRGIDYRVSVNDNGFPIYLTMPEDAIQKCPKAYKEGDE